MHIVAEEPSNSKFNWGKTLWKEQISCKHQYCNVDFEKNSELFSVSSERASLDLKLFDVNWKAPLSSLLEA